jgi:hypothetical protein
MTYMRKAQIILLAVVISGANVLAAEEGELDPTRKAREALHKKGLTSHAIRMADFHEGIAPKDFLKRTGAPYRPSYNEEPSIPAQCWIETSYGTQNACLYCHTDYLAKIKHGNAFPLGEDQVLYSFPSPDLNKVLWRNTIFPQEISERLEKEGIALPDSEDVAYVRRDNWQSAFNKARPTASAEWLNRKSSEFVLFPALNPSHLFPYRAKDPTSGGTHGFVDANGFVRDEKEAYTGWRAVNFFPYGIFTPHLGQCERNLHSAAMAVQDAQNGNFNQEIYQKNLDLLELKHQEPVDIKNPAITAMLLKKRSYARLLSGRHGIRAPIALCGSQCGRRNSAHKVDGVVGNKTVTYEFPGTRSRRVKELRYMYKWKAGRYR